MSEAPSSTIFQIRPLTILPKTSVGHLITLRAVTLLLFVIFLLAGPVPNDADIIATVLAYTLLIVICSVVLATLINGHLIRRNLGVHVFPPDLDSSSQSSDSHKIISRKDCPFLIFISEYRVMPFMTLTLQLEFEHHGVETLIHQLVGHSRAPRHIQDSLRFPHRGYWKCANAKLRFGDQFGLSVLLWNIVDPSSLKDFVVHPAPLAHCTYPVVSSASRAGDALTDIQERRGDPFDLKPYHPSDGASRILWKVYAKSGELVSRHPEKAMTPEGQVLLYALAGATEDYVCSSAAAYVRQLEDLSMEVFLGCEGQGKHPIARSSDQTENLFIETVWDAAEANNGSRALELEELLAVAESELGGGMLQKVVIFCSRERFGSRVGLRSVTLLGEQLERRNISPVFCISSQPPDMSGFRNSAAGERSEGISVFGIRSSLVEKLLAFFIREPSPVPVPDTSYYNEFMGLCLKNNWSVHSD